MNLDDKLREILIFQTKHISTYEPHMKNVIVNIEHTIAQIKELYVKEVIPKTDALVQDMVNLHANMKQDMLRLGLTSTPQKQEVVADFSNGRLSKLMTGQEWYERFEKELPNIAIAELALNGNYHQLMRDKVLKIAKLASGIDK